MADYLNSINSSNYNSFLHQSLKSDALCAVK